MRNEFAYRENLFCRLPKGCSIKIHFNSSILIISLIDNWAIKSFASLNQTWSLIVLILNSNGISQSLPVSPCLSLALFLSLLVAFRWIGFPISSSSQESNNLHSFAAVKVISYNITPLDRATPSIYAHKLCSRALLIDPATVERGVGEGRGGSGRVWVLFLFGWNWNMQNVWSLPA